MRRRLKERLITFVVVVCLLALALYVIYLTQNKETIFEVKDKDFIRNGGFELGSLLGWGAYVVDDPTDSSAAAVVKYEPHSGEYCLALILDGRAKLLRVEPQINHLSFSGIRGFKLLNSSGVRLSVAS